MQPPQLILFDCDGVLVDSELITSRVLAQMLNELGISFTLEDAFEQFTGRSMAYCREVISGVYGRELTEQFVGEYRTRMLAALKSQVTPVPGVEAALDAIEAAGIPYCVASNGTHEKMRTTLGACGLLPRFEDKLFSATEVAQGKPAPDIYLHAAEKFAVAPEACYVVEDSPTGVVAGVSAGMTVYGYCALIPEQRLAEAGAHYTFTAMHEISGLILNRST
jgi:HAD superfamily hydrolase (TIGR01509 family)